MTFYDLPIGSTFSFAWINCGAHAVKLGERTYRFVGDTTSHAIGTVKSEVELIEDADAEV